MVEWPPVIGELKSREIAGKKYVVDDGLASGLTSDEGIIVIAPYFKVKEGDVFFDVGASWPTWTLYALAHGAYVYAFEPSKEHYENIVKYVDANEGFKERCKILNMGLDKTETTRKLIDWYYEHGFKSGVITPDILRDAFFTTIDTFLPELDRLDWIKIDVEGGEYDVILGGLNALERFKPKLIIEDHKGVAQMGDWIRDNKIDEKMLSTLESLGYTITWIPHHVRGFYICEVR